MSGLTHGVMEWMGTFGATGFLAMFILSSFVLVPRPLLCTLAGYILGFWAIPVALGVVVIRRRAKMVLNDSRAPRQRG